MRMFQKEFYISKKSRGFHLITDEVLSNIEEIKVIKAGIANIFLKHTSASLSLNENADSSVRDDFESFFNDFADDKPYYTHTYEGSDDMPAHIKSSTLGAFLTIPITNGTFNLGTWQGIYLGEHRDMAERRKLIITIWGI